MYAFEGVLIRLNGDRQLVGIRRGHPYCWLDCMSLGLSSSVHHNQSSPWLYMLLLVDRIRHLLQQQWLLQQWHLVQNQ